MNQSIGKISNFLLQTSFNVYDEVAYGFTWDYQTNEVANCLKHYIALWNEQAQN